MEGMGTFKIEEVFCARERQRERHDFCACEMVVLVRIMHLTRVGGANECDTLASGRENSGAAEGDRHGDVNHVNGEL